MLPALDTPQLVALAAALGWASGLRLYAVVFLTGLAGRLEWMTLPEGLRVLMSTPLLALSGALLLVEFLADKLPWVDSAWDAVHTVLRIPAGAALAAGVFGGEGAAWTAAAALLGGGLAATSHAAKASVRASANLSPEPFSNWALSLADDLAVPGALWFAWAHPLAFLVVLAVVVVLMLWAVVVLAGRLRRLWRQRPAPPAWLRGAASGEGGRPRY
ncbi:DUF4126 domain-containing protein [Aquabacterium sp. J223]|uniref:DUF4126 domain-containing protein n=1 Tax=Aquabacterium sp. J223 TaxID=2898431 RepID=UPI0021ADCDF5|nr:DUF4126 domain-containing protein [Aquabacterium sp. J223]UUX95828.1 DUF4126 domain-containing protein [Aquabacterium sp. J223]